MAKRRSESVGAFALETVNAFTRKLVFSGVKPFGVAEILPPRPHRSRNVEPPSIFNGFLLMSSILDLAIFVRTADSGSISAATRALEPPASR